MLYRLFLPVAAIFSWSIHTGGLHVGFYYCYNAKHLLPDGIASIQSVVLIVQDRESCKWNRFRQRAGSGSVPADWRNGWLNGAFTASKKAKKSSTSRSGNLARRKARRITSSAASLGCIWYNWLESMNSSKISVQRTTVFEIMRTFKLIELRVTFYHVVNKGQTASFSSQ